MRKVRILPGMGGLFIYSSRMSESPSTWPWVAVGVQRQSSAGMLLRSDHERDAMTELGSKDCDIKNHVMTHRVETWLEDTGGVR